MLVYNTIYAIVIILFFLGILSIANKLAKKVKTNKKHLKIVFFLTPLVCIGLNMIIVRTFPSIYTINSCGNYNKQILLFPTKLPNGQVLKMRNYAYINNQSKSTLHLKTISYGDPLFQNYVDIKVPPMKSLGLPVNRIDYLFETPPESMNVKGFGDVRQYLYCE